MACSRSLLIPAESATAPGYERSGCHPLGQRLELGQRAATTRRVAVQAGLDEDPEGRVAWPGLSRGTNRTVQCLDQAH
jgi:hypothetical protein